jgi:hypothetical protein
MLLFFVSGNVASDETTLRIPALGCKTSFLTFL